MDKMKISIEIAGITYSVEIPEDSTVEFPVRTFLSILVAAGYSKSSIDKLLEFDYENIEGYLANAQKP